MILSDQSIARQISDRTIAVTPDPTPDQYQPASLDLRIGHDLYYPHLDEYYTVDTNIQIPAGDRILATTLETIDLPAHIAGMVAGRSTVGREGIEIHCTAGWIDPGFTGQITLELYNKRQTAFTLTAESRVGQIVFFPLDQPSRGYTGQYDEQDGVEPAGEL